MWLIFGGIAVVLTVSNIVFFILKKMVVYLLL